MNSAHATKNHDKKQATDRQADRHTDRPIERDIDRDTRFYRKMGINKKTRWLKDEFMT